VKIPKIQSLVPVAAALAVAGLVLSGCAATAPHPVTASASASSASLVQVTVQVQGTGVATEVAVTVGEQATAQPNVQLPFARTIRVPAGTPVRVDAQNGTDTGALTATVTEQGKTRTDSAAGEFATVSAGSTDLASSAPRSGAAAGAQASVSPSPLPVDGEVLR
jgi:hypothetical protein